MAGRPKIFNEEEALDKAIDLFWSRGYEATSMDHLLKNMNLKKGSLYHSFGSKKELFIKALDHFKSHTLRDLKKRFDQADDPIKEIHNFFIELAKPDMMPYEKGCFLCNTLVEMTDVDEELQEKAASHLKELEDVFYKYVHEAKQKQNLKTTESAKALARYLLTVWNGINVTRRIYPDREVLEEIIKTQLKILQ